jgi:hypothetical protein
LGTFLSCNKKVSRPPGRDPASPFEGTPKVGAGGTAILVVMKINPTQNQAKRDEFAVRDR